MGDFVEKFVFCPSAEQEAKLDEWLETCRIVWNLGRRVLIELDESTTVNKLEDPETGKKKAVALPSCRLAVCGETAPRPMPVAWFKNEVAVEGQEKKEVVWALHSWILPKGRKGGTVDVQTGESDHAIRPDLIRVGQCCPVAIPEWREPRLGLQVLGKYSLQYYFTQKNVEIQYPWFSDRFKQVPSWFIRGVCSSLWEAWSRYKKRQAGCPRHKGASDVMTSLSYEDGKKLTLTQASDLNEAERTSLNLGEDDGLIEIPRLAGQRPGALAVRDLAKRFSVDTDSGRTLRAPSVARLVRISDGWQLHLTAYEPTRGEINTLALVAGALPQPKSRLQLLLLQTALWRRNHDLTLTVPGDGFVVAVDDRGRGYSVLPRRHSDGALDPHDLVAKLDRQIEELSKQISWKAECSKRHRTPRHSNRLAALKQEKRKLERHRAAIPRSSRQKIAYFLSERSHQVSVFVKESQRHRKPKRKLKEGSNPAQYDPNGARQVAEHNREKARSSPGEFVALLKRNATNRGQSLRVDKPEKKK